MLLDKMTIVNGQVRSKKRTKDVLSSEEYMNKGLELLRKIKSAVPGSQEESDAKKKLRELNDEFQAIEKDTKDAAPDEIYKGYKIYYEVGTSSPQGASIYDPDGKEILSNSKLDKEGLRKKVDELTKNTKDTDSIEFSKLMELVKEGRIEIYHWINFQSGQNHGWVEVRGTNNKISNLTVENIPDNYKP